MRLACRFLWCLSAFITLLVLLAFPLSANAQNKIAANADLNHDGTSDLLWYNPATGQTVVWLMDGTTISSSDSYVSDPNWKIIKTADFNGDGMADLLWENAATGETGTWLMNGTSVSIKKVLITERDWKVVEAADLNGDGKADLLWRNTGTGETAAWLMDGTSVLTWKVLIAEREWKIVASADLNGDGKADLLWQNASTGQTAAWLMDGTSVLTWTVLLTERDWKIVAAADLNGDGKADLVWHNASAGQTAAWLMNGTSVLTWTVLFTDPDWKVVATADFDGDGKADLLWHNKLTGHTAAWVMNGTSKSTEASLLIDPNSTVNAIGDLNGDGKYDLLWYNAATDQTSAWLMNGIGVTSRVNLTAGTGLKQQCINSTSLTFAMACDDTVLTKATGTAPVNKPPVVNAGADQTITLPATANLSGYASDDSSQTAVLTSRWSQVSGPGSVAFSNSTNLQTTAVFPLAGAYTLRLTATRGTLSNADDVVVVVNDCGTVVSGTVKILANASDSVGVAGVQTMVDGKNMGPNLTKAPYSVIWNTTTIPNGCHQITVTAQNAVGTKTTVSLLATVRNP